MAKTLVARSPEIDCFAVLVQQQYVIGFSLENFATNIFQGKGSFSPADVDATTRSPIRAHGACDTTKGQDEDSPWDGLSSPRNPSNCRIGEAFDGSR
jgi:hypothetical protein